jgi:heat shock protein HslJ
MSVMLVALLVAGCGGDDDSSDAEDLSGTQWQATTIGSADALADAPATLALLEDGNIAGTAGCNNYNGVW